MQGQPLGLGSQPTHPPGPDHMPGPQETFQALDTPSTPRCGQGHVLLLRELTLSSTVFVQRARFLSEE